MADDKSTNEIRMIASGVVEQQARVCEVHRETLAERLRTLSDTAQSNMRAVAELTKVVAVLAETVKLLPAQVRENEDAISKLQGRPAVWAAIGAALPTLLGVLLWWFSK